jgi:hypothetical protein
MLVFKCRDESLQRAFDTAFPVPARRPHLSRPRRCALACRVGRASAASSSTRRRIVGQQIARPTDQDIDREMTNLCRCATYVRIRTAIHLAAKIRRDATTRKAP